MHGRGHRRERVAHVQWDMTGVHSQLNALAAIAAAEHAGVAPGRAARALAKFTSVKRRLRPHERILAVFEPRSNTMKLGAMKAQLPWALEEADLSFCHSGGLTWDAVQTLAPMGARAAVVPTIAELVNRVVASARSGDHILCMSNGGFGGVHDKLLEALAPPGRAAA